MRIALVMLAVVACSSPGRSPVEPVRDLSQRPTPATPPTPTASEPVGDRAASIEAMNRGIEAFNTGDLFAATTALKTAVDKDPTYAMAHYNLGQVLLARKAYDEALEPLATAARLSPDDAMIRLRHGEVLVRLEKHAEAVPALEAAIARESKLFLAHGLLGDALVELGKHGPAARSWTRACELAPERGRSYLRLAWLYLRWRERAAARAVLEVAARSVKDPFELADVYLGLGTSRSVAGQRAEAVAALDAALAANPKLLEARLQRGLEYLALGDRARAKADLEAVVKAGAALPFDRQAANQGLMRASSARRGKKVAIPSSPTLTATALPPVPSLVLPASSAARSVLRLQVQREKHLDSTVTVTGTIVWIYDCASEQRRPGESTRSVRKRLAQEPELCSRPSLKLGDSAQSRPEDALWVVEVPRPIRPDERKHLDEETIKSWPKVPKIKVGDRVVITGKFARQSPRGFSDSDGLLVYEALKPIK